MGILNAPCKCREKLRLPAFALVLMTSREKVTGEKLLTKHYLGDQIKKEIGGTCNTYGETERGIPAVGGETSEKETAWKT